MLYVYDVQTGELVNMGEEGLGAYTVDCCWDAGRDVLYAVSGDLQAQKLMRLDLGLEAEQVITTLVDEAFYGGGIAARQIRSITAFPMKRAARLLHTPLDGTSEAIGTGGSFTINADGTSMAVLRAVQSEEGERANLVFIDLQTKATQLIMEDAAIMRFCFAGDGTLFIATGVQDSGLAYQTELWCFDGCRKWAVS